MASQSWRRQQGVFAATDTSQPPEKQHQPTSISPSLSTQRESHRHLYGPNDRTLAQQMKSTIAVDSESSSCVHRARMCSTHVGMPDSAPSQMSRTRVNEFSVCPSPTASSSSPLPDLWAGVEAWAWRHATTPWVCWQPRRQSWRRSSRSDGQQAARMEEVAKAAPGFGVGLPDAAAVSA